MKNKVFGLLGLHLMVGLLTIAVAQAQDSGSRGVHLVVGYVDYEVDAPYSRSLSQGNARSTSTGVERINTPAFALGLGYEVSLEGPWRVAITGRYAGSTTDFEEHLWEEYRRNHPGSPPFFAFQTPRQFRAVLGSTLLFWEAVAGSRLSLDAGVGLGFVLRWHQYRSGFDLNVDTWQFEKEVFTNERRSSMGIPAALRLRSSLGRHLSVALELGGSIFIEGESVGIAGLQIGYTFPNFQREREVH